MRSHGACTVDRYLAVAKLAPLRNNVYKYPFRVSRLVLNDCSAHFMPAELIVEYHHHAKATARAIWPVSRAFEAYGDCYRNYVATDESFKQGGYETQPP
jgi:hypothetical protein